MWKLAREWLSGAAGHRGRASICSESVSIWSSFITAAILPSCWPARFTSAGHWARCASCRGEWRRVPSLAVDLCRYLALERARGSDRHIFSRSDHIGRMRCAAKLSATAPGRDGHGWRIRPRGFLYFARCVGAALGPNRASRGGQLAPGSEFPFHHASDPDFVLFNWKVSWMAVGVMLSLASQRIFVAKKRREFRRLCWVLITLGVVSILLMFRPSQLLWQQAARIAIRAIPVEMA